MKTVTPSFPKVLLLLFAVLLGAAPAAAQRGPSMPQPAAATDPIGQILGSVVDEDNGTPVPTATIAVWRTADSTLVTGTISDDEGNFFIGNLNPGAYTVKISFIGYAERAFNDVTLTLDTPRFTLGAVRLSPDIGLLDEIEVTTDRETVEFAIDRTVYNTKQMVVSSGGTATDVLQNVPSVEVDVDGKVSLRGNQNVAILINGKPAPVSGDFLNSFLQQLPANSIEKVEVIPNPSAKYDPDGMAGILNIVLKQDVELGIGGGLTFGLATGGKYNASPNVTYQKGKVSLFTSYGFRYEDRSSTGFNFRENSFQDPLNYLEQDNTGSSNRVSHLFNTSLDYKLSDKNSLSASTLLSTRNSDNEGLNTYTELGPSRDPSSRFDRLSEDNDSGFNMDYKLGFKRTLEAAKHEFSADLRYNRSYNDDFSTFTERTLTLDGLPGTESPAQQTNTLDNRDQEWELQIDYTRPLGKMRLETGYKGSIERLDNDFYATSFDDVLQAFTPDTDLNNTFSYNEQVHAAYGILNRGFGKFDAQAGLRLEQALTTFDLATTAERFENNYFSAFPSVFVAYKPTEGRQIRLSYSKRIERPRTRQLNPFTTYADPLNLFVGNPYLKPEYTHAYELAYQQFTKKGSISVTPFYRHTVDVVRRLQTVSPDGVSTVTFQNFNTSKSYGAEFVGTLRLGQKLSGFASFNTYKMVTDGSNVEGGLGSDALAWSMRGSLSLKVRKGLDVQMFYFYRAPIDVEQGRISSFSMANIAIKQMLLNDKASLSLRLSDPFNTMGFNFQTRGDGYYQEGGRKWESRVAYLTFTYNFGRKPSTRNRNDQDNNEGGGMGDMGIN